MRSNPPHSGTKQLEAWSPAVPSAIAAALKRAPSTISREISCNGGTARYRATVADSQAWKRALRPKRCKLAVHARLRQAVATKLEMDWSPEQISGWLKRTFPRTEASHVSHETIYRSLYAQARGVLKKSCLSSCERAVRSAARATQRQEGSARPHPLRGVDQPAPCFSGGSLYRVIGKAISSADRRTASLSPWSNGIRATCCSPRSPASSILADHQSGLPAPGRCSDRMSSFSSRTPPRLAGRRSHRPLGLQVSGRADPCHRSDASPACARTSRESGRLRACANSEAGGCLQISS